ncbi:RagB/SusD family nutrient uptake outer membrane protein [Terrimonas sp.]|uniref:RagB/SusD family nutrient uptake outer membrane protein n=1 Tax=Terrimonas sp. TaxID=1914338 RepID=UPI000D5099FA|nr:RagB/SusD family nutrient uptake outer membrane protein [Terrimonas sp.]PVD52233.1 RagB/SusD family nutrient uptake outer membrane protein [Terrimonas sp.]
MKKLFYIVYIAVMGTSCNKLELAPLDRLSEANVWNDPSLIQLYVNGSYSSLLHEFQQDLMSAACDETYNIHNWANMRMAQNGEITADNVSNISNKINYFNFAYSYIRDINIFFEKIEAAPGDDAFKKQVKGEMGFLRAYIYANLIWRYGGIPIITNVFELNGDFTVSRASYDECVSFIVSELDNAAGLLPANQPSAQMGRASANACKALKSRVLLYAASIQNNPDHNTAKWQAAADAAEDLLNAGFSLNGDYQLTFLGNTSEVIFARYFSQANSTSFNQWQGRNGSDGFGANNPTQNLVNAYEMKATGLLPYNVAVDGSLTLNAASGYDPNNPYAGRDPRFDASILHDGSVWAGRETETFEGGKDSPEAATAGWNASLTSYYMKKFMNENIPPSGSTVRPTNPWIFFRYAEILLNYAEAKLELGDEVTAREYINMVRSRPGVEMPDVTESGDALRSRLQNERRVEFAFEGQRFFDVRRWKIALQTEATPLLSMDIKKSGALKTYAITTLASRIFVDANYLMPIPRAEIDKSKGSLTQNTGY